MTLNCTVACHRSLPRDARPDLIPTEPKSRARFEQAASIEYAQFNPIVSGIGRIITQYDER